MAAPRPLKRPRLGQPDVYPQDSKQREVIEIQALELHFCRQLKYISSTGRAHRRKCQKGI